MDKRKRHAEGIGHSRSTLGTSSIGTDYDSLLVVRNVELYVFAKEMAAVEIVYGDVEEALILRVW